MLARVAAATRVDVSLARTRHAGCQSRYDAILLAASLSISAIERQEVCRPGHSVGLSVQSVSCGKTADRIWMPFGVVSGVDRGMGVLDEVNIWQREVDVLGVLSSIGLNDVFECILKQKCIRLVRLCVKS